MAVLGVTRPDVARLLITAVAPSPRVTKPSQRRITPSGVTRRWPTASGWPASLVATRSEEHTSELQSLMRISYAVFCLKKKKQNHIDIILNVPTQSQFDTHKKPHNHTTAHQPPYDNTI